MDACVHMTEARRMPTVLPQLLRADALENRSRALEAARELFSERGIDAVTMRDIARRAEIGPATLYRRFPTKQSLVDEAFAEEMTACARLVHDGASAADAWQGFCAVVTEICVLNARNQGFTDAFTGGAAAGASHGALAAHRAELLRAMSGLARRAQRAGRLRADFTINDFVLILSAGRGLATVPRGRRKAAARRFAALAIDAFHAPAAGSA
jgi:AcrR family transcriptional regulator